MTKKKKPTKFYQFQDLVVVGGGEGCVDKDRLGTDDEKDRITAYVEIWTGPASQLFYSTENVQNIHV